MDWKKQKAKHSYSERGNVFFTLFGAVAIVGVLGAGIMATMRGPLSTMVEVNRRTQAESQMSIASKLAMLAAVENVDDCDGDGFVEPAEFVSNAAAPTGGGYLPTNIGSARIDPWGSEFGYCVWDAGVVVDNSACEMQDGSAGFNRLDGDGSASTSYTMIAIISAGPDRTFQTTCSEGPPDITRGGDDLVTQYDYQEAAAASDGLWKLKTGDPNTAEIDRGIDVAGDAQFSSAARFQRGIDLTGSSAALELGAASMLFPTQAELATCNPANDGLLRVNTASDPDTLEICDDPTGWVSVAEGATGLSPWEFGAADDIYYNSGSNPYVGIGLTDPSQPLDVAGNIQSTGDIMLSSGGVRWSGNNTIGGSGGAIQLNADGGAIEIDIDDNDVSIDADTTITGSTADNTADALTVEDSANTPILTVQNDGMVGIGVPDPNDALDVSGVIDITETYNIDGNVIVRTDTGSPDSLFLGRDAGGTESPASSTVVGGSAGLAFTSAAEYNTVIGAGAAPTLATGINNILIGAHDTTPIDVDAAGASNYLNIGNAIFGDLSTGRVGIGQAPGFDVTGLTYDLEVAGDIGATNVTAGTRVTTNQLYVNNTDNFVPSACGVNYFNRWDGNSWECELDSGGGGAAIDFTDLGDTPAAYTGAAGQFVVVNGGESGLVFVSAGSFTPTLSEVLAAGNNAGNQDALNFSGIAVGSAVLSTGAQALELDVTGDIGADFYCDASGNNCFTAGGITASASPGAPNRSVQFNNGGAFDGDANFIYTSAGQLGVGTGTPEAELDIAGTGAFLPPRGDTAQRPVAPVNGMLRYNSQTDRFEGFQGGTWYDILTSGGLATPPDRGIQFNSGGAFAADTNFVFTSAGQLGIGTASPDSELTLFDNAGANTRLKLRQNNNNRTQIMFSEDPTDNNTIGFGLVYEGSANQFSIRGWNGSDLGNGIAQYLTIERDSGLIGINQPAPQTRLDIDGTLKIAYGNETCDAAREGAIHYDSGANQFYVCRTAGSWEALTTSGAGAAAPDRGVQFNSGGALAATSNFIYTSTGRLGLNTAAPLGDLHIATDGLTDRTLYIGGTSIADTAMIRYQVSDQALLISNYYNNNPDEGNIRFYTSNLIPGVETPILSLYGQAGAGIGIFDQTPDARLEIGMTDPWANNSSPAIMVSSTDAADGDMLLLTSAGRLGLNTTTISDGSGSGGQQLLADIEGPLGATWYCDEDGLNCFDAGDVGAAVPGDPDRSVQFNSNGTFTGDANFVFTSAGRLGIGTGSPIFNLSVHGDDGIGLTNLSGDALLSLAGTGDGSSYSVIGLSDLTNGRAWYTAHAEPSNDYVFLYQDGTTTEHMRLTSTGRLGIGTSAPIAQLSVGAESAIGGNTVVANFSGPNSPAQAGEDALIMFSRPTVSGGIVGLDSADETFIVATGETANGFEIRTNGNFGTGIKGGASAFRIENNGLIRFQSTGATVLNLGTTAQRPGTPENGMIRYNTDNDRFEGFQDGAWQQILTNAVAGGAAAPNRGIQFNSGGEFAASSSFVYTSDGDFLLIGTHTGTASVPATGAGTRMFFDVQKSAFRAGYVPGTQWDNASIGDYSAAFGRQSIASGANSFAAGYGAQASNTSSVALGESATASGINSFAWGNSATASNNYAAALGQNAIASGANSFAAGGRNVTASGARSVALGSGDATRPITAGGIQSVAIGRQVNASGNGSFAFGLVNNGVTITTTPQVSGVQSFGIFMGDQDGGVNLAANNTMGLFGGQMIIDPAIPVANLVADTAFEVEGTIKMAYGGELCDASREGAMHYNSSDDTFYLCETSGAWVPIITGGAGGAGNAAGSDRQVQFNSNGDLWADTNFVLTSAGRLGVGTNAPTSRLDVAGAVSVGNVTENDLPAISAIIGGMPASSTDNMIGLSINGLTSLLAPYTGTIAGADMYVATSTAVPAASAVNSYGVRTFLTKSGPGSQTNAYNFYARSPDVTGGTLANAYGLYLEDITVGSTSNYAIYSEGGTNYLGGALGIGSGTVTPDTQLEVNGTIKMAYGGEACDASREGAIHYDSSSDRFYVCQNAAEGWVQIATNNATAAAPNRGIQFNSGGNFAAASSFVYTTNGQVGIGDSTPNGLLGLRAVGAGVQIGIDLYNSNTASSALDTLAGINVGGSLSTNYSHTGTLVGLDVAPWVYTLLGGSTSNNYYAIRSRMTKTGGVGSVLTNAYMLYAENPNATVGTITNAYGLYLQDITEGTGSNYAIYSEGGTNYLGGALGIGSGTVTPDTQLEVNGTIKMAYGGELCDASREGAIHYDSSVDQFYVCRTAGGWDVLSTGGATPPAAPDRSVQFNSGGNFAGLAGFTVGTDYTVYLPQIVGGGLNQSRIEREGNGAAIEFTEYNLDLYTGPGGGVIVSWGDIRLGGDPERQIALSGGPSLNFDGNTNVMYTSGVFNGFGIYTDTPDTMLDVAGTIKMAYGGELCDASREGAIHYDSSVDQFYVCRTAGGWDVLSTGGATPPGAPDRSVQFNSGGVFTGNQRFVYTVDGDFIVGSNQIEDTGTGTEDNRMFFDVSQGAFRAGSVDAGQWDYASSGQYSIALGRNVRASSSQSVAIGSFSSSTATGAVALGQSSTASGLSSLAAVGGTASASRAVALGSADATASDTFAVGSNATASGIEAIAIGENSTASGYKSHAFGGANAAGARAMAFNYNMNVTGNASYGVSLLANATNPNNSVSSTTDYTVSGDSSVAFFMGNAGADIDFSSDRTFGVFGGQMVIDPRLPSSNLSADTALEVEGTIKMAYGGEACDASREGAIHYDSSVDQFYVCRTAGGWDVLSTGGATPPAAPDMAIQFNSGGVFGGSNNMVWDNSNRFMGINLGGTAPGAHIDINPESTDIALAIQADDSGDYYTAVDHSQGPSYSGKLSIISNGADDTVAPIHIATPGVGSSTAEIQKYGIIMLGKRGSAWNNTGNPVVQDDILPGIGWAGQSDGTATGMMLSAQINAEVDGPVSSNTVPMRLTFRTSQNNSGGGANMIERMRIASDGTVSFQSTGALVVNRGDTAQRPASPVNGMLRYNSQTDRFEGYQANAWQDILTSGGLAAAPDRGIQFNSGGNFTADSNFIYTSAGELQLTGTGSSGTYIQSLELADPDGEFARFTNTLGNSVLSVESGSNYPFMALRDQGGNSRVRLDSWSSRYAYITADTAGTALQDGAVGAFGAGLHISVPSGLGNENGISFNDGTTISNAPGAAITYYDADGLTFSRGGLRFKTRDGDLTTRMQIDQYGTISFESTGAFIVNRGDTSQRPASPVNGMLRYNSTTERFEGYQNNAWQDILTSSIAGGAAAPDRGIQFNSGGSFAASGNFVYTSDGDLLLSGTHTGTASVPASGAGTRMFFDPQTSAFRAGRVSSTQWDNANIGAFSTALGFDVVASGAQSFATGYDTVASGNYSTSMGRGTDASGAYSYAIGLGDPTGVRPQVSGNNAFGIFMGDQSGINLASANTMAILGGDFIVGSYQLDDTGNAAHDARMFFDKSKAAFRAGLEMDDSWDDANVGNISIGLGIGTRASGDQSVAIGSFNGAMGFRTISIGTNTQAYYSGVAIGNAASSSGSDSLAIGNAVTTTGHNSMALGSFVNAGDGLYNGGFPTGGPLDATLGEGSMAIGLITDANEPGTYPTITGDESLGIFMGDQSGVDLSSSNVMGLFGGELMIDYSSATPGRGCIRYNEGTTQLEFSNDCSSYSGFGVAGGASAPDRGIQFNSGGNFAAESRLTYTSTGILTFNGLDASGGTDVFLQAIDENSSQRLYMQNYEGGGTQSMTIGSGAANITFSDLTNCCDPNTAVTIGTGTSGPSADWSGLTIMDGDGDATGNHYIFTTPTGQSRTLAFKNTSGGIDVANIQVTETGPGTGTMELRTVGVDNQLFLENNADGGGVGIGIDYASSKFHVAGTIQMAYSGESCDAAREGAIHYDSSDDTFYVCRTAGGWEAISTGPSGAYDEFVNLIDTPGAYVGEAGKFVRVNTAENALEFTDEIIDIVSGEPAPTPMNIDDLGDVSVASPTDGYVLSYDSASGNWVAADVGSLSSGAAAPDRAIQFNSGGAFTADGRFTFTNGGDPTLYLYDLTTTTYLGIRSGLSTAILEVFAPGNTHRNMQLMVNRLHITPGAPSPDTRLDVDGTIKMAYGGEVCDADREGAIHYDSSDDTFYVCATAGSWEAITYGSSGGYDSFVSLNDTPANYTGAAGQFARVTSAEDGLEFTDEIIETVSGSPAPTAMVLNDLGDVAAASPTDGYVLSYDSASGNWVAASVGSVGGGIWEDVSGTGDGPIRFTSGTINYASADFVVGSPQLADTGDAAHDSRMFFDKSKGAFRAGIVDGAQWDDGNVGTGSAAFSGGQASGNYSLASGWSTYASGQNSFVLGNDAAAQGNNSLALGSFLYTNAARSTVLGTRVNTGASGNFSMAIGVGDSPSNPREVNAPRSLGVFIGDTGGYSLTSSDLFAVIGGQMMIDYDSSGSRGCIRYNEATSELQFSHDCAAYTAMGSSAASDEFVELTDTPASYTGAAGQFARVTSAEDGLEFTDEIIEQVAGNAPVGMGLDNLSDVTLGSLSDGYVLSYDSTSGNWVAAAASAGAIAIDDLTDAATNYTSGNIYLGQGSGDNTTSGGENTSLGENTLAAITTGSRNTAIGSGAMYSVIGGIRNTAVGSNSMNALQGGNFNAALGYRALENNVNGEYNTALGAHSLLLATGTGNIGIGYTAGDNLTTGTGNIGIGYGIDFSSNNVSYELNIGNVITGDMATGDIAINGTAALRIPQGTTAQRPATGLPGMLRYNSTNDTYEAYVAGSINDWQGLSFGSSGNYDSFVSLTDTPAAYTAAAGQFARVTSAEDGLEFTDQIIEQVAGNAPVDNVLNDLGDVTTAGASDGDFLKYDSATGMWIADSATGGSVSGGDRELQFNSGGAFGSDANFVYTSAGDMGIGTNAPVAKLDVEGAIQISYNSEACTAVSDIGKMRFNGSAFEICQDHTTGWEPLFGAGGGGACDTTETYNSGTNSYTVPADFATLTVTMWGGGGGGGGADNGAAGGNGGNTTITSLGLSASGGSGAAGTFTGNGTGGAGGSASGGDINTNGNAGGNGGSGTSGAGGSAPNGGAGGSGVGGNVNGIAGATPGAGGSGAAYGSNSAAAGGGGSGAYVQKVYTPVSLTPSTLINDITVGPGGAGGNSTYTDGGAGANGRVTITCSTGGITPPNERQIVFVSGGAYAGDSNFTYTSDGQVIINTTAALTLPAGTTAQRPTGVPGMIRYNSTNDTFEGYVAGSINDWQGLSFGSSGTYDQFTDLTDSPANYTGAGGQFVRVNSAENALEFTADVIESVAGNAPDYLDLADLGDVDTTGVSDGYVLSYNSTSGNWVAADASSLSTLAINDLTDSATNYTSGNMFLGQDSGTSATGDRNTALGQNALNALTSGLDNTAIGWYALDSVTTGSNNVAIGRDTLGGVTTGGNNIGLGFRVLMGTTTGSNNIGMGSQALNGATGSNNFGIGMNSLISTAGNDNIAMGIGALRYNSTGDRNLALGHASLLNTYGNNNIALGYQAGDNITTGNNNLIIGYDIDAASATADYQINIGNVITGTMNDGDIAINGTAALRVPQGTTAQRPTGLPGMIRYNSTNDTFEGYIAGSINDWQGLSFGSSGTYDQFTDLTDTPANYTGAGGQFARVNSGETALEFTDQIIEQVAGDPPLGIDLDYLDNVAISSPADGYVLSYDSASGNWVAAANTATASAAGADGQIQFNSGGSALGADSLFVYSSVGYLGVGTASPTALIHANDTSGQVLFRGTESGVDRFVVSNVSGSGTLQLNNGAQINTVFLDSNGDSWLTGGDVGIGNNAPTERLDVTGNIAVSGMVKVGGTAGSAPTFFSLNDLSDVDTSGIADNYVLTYDSASGNWGAEAAGAGSSLWTDNTTHISYGSAHIIAPGSTMPAGLGVGGGMIWYASKSAFRAGSVIGTEWDEASIGLYSIALGMRNSATGESSFSAGYRSDATGDYSVGIGSQADASGYGAVSLGSSSDSSGTNSMAIGTFVAAAGQGSTAFGYKTTTGAAANQSIAIGLGDAAGTFPTVTGANSLGIFMGDQSGIDLTSSNTMAVLGGDFIVGSPSLSDTENPDHYARMFFDKSKAAFRVGKTNGGGQWDDANVGNDSIAIGANTTASSEGTVAIGYGADATGWNAIAFGLDADASQNDGVAIGRFVTVSGVDSSAFGRRVEVTGQNSLGIGVGNAVNDFPEVSGNDSVGIFMGSQEYVNLSSSNVFGIFGGDIMLDYVSTGSRGCIRYNETSSQLEFSHDCSTYSAMGGGGGALNDLSDAAVSYTSSNMFLGTGVGGSGTGGTNTGIGVGAMQNLTTGYWSVAVGFGALGNMTDASNNVAVGPYSMGAVTSGYGNTAIGGSTLGSLVTGFGNTAIGDNALAATTANFNTAVGQYALDEAVGGGANIAVGADALGEVIDGWGNVGIGNAAGDNITSGTENIIIGFNVDAASATGSSQLNIGNSIWGQMDTGTIYISGSGALALPAGITGDRPGTPVAGMIRFNNSTGFFEGYDGAQWEDINTGSGGLWSAGTGDDIYYNSGTPQVGIGTATPAYELEVAGTTATTDLVITGVTGASAPVGAVPLMDTLAAGANTQIQYNSNGNFGATTNLIWDNVNATLSTSNIALSGQFYGSGYVTGPLTAVEHSQGVGYSAPINSFGASGDTVGAYHAAFASSNSKNTYALIGMGMSGSAYNSTNPAALSQGDYLPGLGFAGQTNTTQGTGMVIGASINAIVDGTVTSGNLPTAIVMHTSTSNSGGLTERMRIESDGDIIFASNGGNIGIGNASPDVELDVTGDIEYTGTITDVSDVRLKDNITPLSDRGSMIARLDDIGTYSFTMKDDKEGRTEFGVIAQEIEKVFPELVKTAEDEMGTKSVNYVGLIAPVIEASKELKAENESLRAELDDIKKQVDLLNKTAGENVGKASMGPTKENWLYLLLGILGSLCVFLLATRRKPA